MASPGADPRVAIASPLLGEVPHAFLTGPGREGDPDPARIVPGGQLVKLKQVHSAAALAVHGPFPADALPEADGLATATPRIVLAIVTADCAPVLLADPDTGVIGAAHAGWRGAIGGVLEATLAQMEGLGARRESVRAAIGPTIAQPSYEVDEGLRDRFVADDPRNAAHFAPGAPGHFQFDLPAYVRQRLALAGVGQVEDLGLDTYADSVRFHSFRRATHRGEPTYGRQYSLIGLPGR